MYPYSKALTATIIPNEGFIVTDAKGAFQFIMDMDGKGYFTRPDFNNGQAFFVSGAGRLDKFKALCNKHGFHVNIKEANSFTFNTYTDHNSHVYAFSNAPMSQKKTWCRAQIAKIDAVDCYGSADGYYQAMDRKRELSAALVNKTAIEYDPVGFWHNRQSN